MWRFSFLVIVSITGCSKKKSEAEQWEEARNWITQTQCPDWIFDEGVVKLPKTQFAVVTRNEARAVAELKDIAFKSLTSEEANHYLERPLVGDGKPFLLRGVALNPSDGSFQVIWHNDYVVVEYCGHVFGRPEPHQRKVIVALLPATPTQLYIELAVAD